MDPNLSLKPAAATPLLECAIAACSARFTLDAAFRVAICFAQTGLTGIAAFQCNTEHYGCTPDHAWQAAQLCFTQHLHPAYDAAPKQEILV